jgi:hypothetical protein
MLSIRSGNGGGGLAETATAQICRIQPMRLVSARWACFQEKYWRQFMPPNSTRYVLRTCSLILTLAQIWTVWGRGRDRQGAIAAAMKSRPAGGGAVVRFRQLPLPVALPSGFQVPWLRGFVAASGSWPSISCSTCQILRCGQLVSGVSKGTAKILGTTKSSFVFVIALVQAHGLATTQNHANASALPLR